MKILNSSEKIAYDQAREELGQGFRDYIEPVQALLEKAGRKVNADKITRIRNGKGEDWQILNAIRAVRGLPIVVPVAGPTEEEIAAKLKLQFA